MRLLEEGVDGLGDDGADFAHARELVDVGIHDRVERAEVPRRVFGRALDMYHEIFPRGILMEVIQFLVQGSAAEPYEVTFKKERNNLSAFCTCKAGQHGQHCKHRVQILTGNAEGIVSDNSEQVPTVVAWAAGTDVDKAMTALKQAERELEQVKKKVAKARKSLDAVMQS